MEVVHREHASGELITKQGFGQNAGSLSLNRPLTLWTEAFLQSIEDGLWMGRRNLQHRALAPAFILECASTLWAVLL